MTNKGIIDYGKAEGIITKLENVFAKYNLTLDEKFLVIRFLNERLQKIKSKDMATGLMGNLPIGGLIKKIIDGKKDE